MRLESTRALRFVAANRCRPGFSLIEVVMALAILGTGLILIIGLLPTGLQTGRAASDSTMAAMIAQDIVNDIRLRANNPANSAIFPAPTTGSSNTASVYPSPSYYNVRGLSYDDTVTGSVNAAGFVNVTAATGHPYYRADVVIVRVVGSPTTDPLYKAESVTVTVAWPVVSSGNVPCINGTLAATLSCPAPGARNKVVYVTEVAKQQFP